MHPSDTLKPQRRSLRKRILGSNLLRLAVARVFFRSIPHGRRTGMRAIRYTGRTLEAQLPYNERLAGNPATGVMHGGAITTLIDQTCGAAASLSVYPPALVATLDLRVDHLRPARPGRAVHARAEAYRVTPQIIFVRCVAHDGEPERPVAVAMSSFMRNGSLIPSRLRKLLVPRGRN